MQEALSAAANLITSAQNITCLTGAGVSVESGLATFRDTATGQWVRIDPAKFASQKGFLNNPGMVWRWYMKHLVQMSNAQPNAGHMALAELEAHVPAFTLITQNVDDLHERGGSNLVFHIHGSICRFRCNNCRKPYTLTQEDLRADLPPLCSHCFDFIRPDVVWFEEPIPTGILDLAYAAARQCDVMLLVGTSGAVYPASELPLAAKESGAAIIEINPDVTDNSAVVDIYVRGPSGIILPQLLSACSFDSAHSVAKSQTN